MKNKIRKIISVTLILCLVATLFLSENIYAATIKLNKSNVTISIGQTLQLQVIGTTKPVKWTSGNSKIVTVSNKGLVKGVSDGFTTIIATVKNVKYKCKIFVGKTVKVTFAAAIFEGDSIEEYMKEQMKENSEYISVEKYNDEYFIVTMLESNRKSVIKTLNNTMEEFMNEFISDKDFNGAFTSIKYNSDLSEIEVYANSEKYENLDFASNVSFIIGLAFVSDYYQAYNLVDINNRKGIITIYDKDTNEVLYSSEE
jgi:hypothetical protein